MVQEISTCDHARTAKKLVCTFPGQWLKWQVNRKEREKNQEKRRAAFERAVQILAKELPRIERRRARRRKRLERAARNISKKLPRIEDRRGRKRKQVEWEGRVLSRMLEERRQGEIRGGKEEQRG